MKEFILLNDSQLRKRLAKMPSYDIAKFIENSSPDMQMRIINLMTLPKTIDVFIELPKEIARHYFTLLTEAQKVQFLSGFEMDELKVFITSFDEDIQPYLIGLLSQRKQQILKRLMSYDDESIASLMTTEFMTINEDLSIKEATAYVITNVKDHDFIDDIFVVNNQVLKGSVALKDLISARANQTLDSITYKIDEYLTVEDSIYQGFLKFKNYGKNSLPVLDSNHHILGIVTADDILNEIVEGHEEAIEKMTAVGDFDEASSPVKRTVQRIPWLLVSVVLNLVIALFLSIFEATIAEVVALILFQPMILGMAGNIGTQAIAVTILKLNQDELEHQHLIKRHVAKEIGIGFINSLLVGISGFLLSLVILSLIQVGIQDPKLVAVTIGLSLFGAMIISTAAGVFIPLFLTKFKVDPAVASGPIISTINDLFALVVYFGIATLVFMT